MAKELRYEASIDFGCALVIGFQDFSPERMGVCEMNLSRKVTLFTGALISIISALFGMTAIKLTSDSLMERTGEVVILIVAAVVVLLGISAAAIFGKAISRPIKELSLIAGKLAMGEVDVTVNASANGEIGALMQSFSKIINNIKNQATAAESVAKGDLSIEIIPRSDKDVLANSMKSVIDILKSLVAETSMLTEAAAEGNLSARVKADSFYGEFRGIVEGTNNTLDGIANPLNIVLDFIRKVANGEELEEVENNYKGQYGVLIENLMLARESLNNFSSGVYKLVNPNDFEYVPDFEIHKGIYRKMIKSIDESFGAIAEPLQLSREYMLKIGNGEIPEKIKIENEGVLADIQKSINSCIDGLSGLIEEKDILKRMSVNDYSTAVNGSYKGIYAEIAESINAIKRIMDDVTETMKDMANGDLTWIDEVMAVQQRSEQDVIVPTLKRMVQNIKNSVEEVTMLTNSVIEGVLDTRADEDKFEGSWKEVVAGMNAILEEVSKPVKDITNVMQEISTGNLQITVRGAYKGDFATLSEAVNVTSITLNGIVGKITEVIKRIASGDLDLEHMDKFRGDFVSISDSINTIIDSLNSVLGEINSAAEQVASGSVQVSEGSQTLSQGSTEQASSVEELTASLSEIATQTKQNAKNANEANESAVKAKEHAEKGNDHMLEMLKSMNDISEASSSISKIIKVIDDIAFQTNILALNAAVEAARAGQHGKGFAVVAEEVRSLALRSAEAASGTTNMIEGSINKVQTGMKIANNTASALNEIVTEIEKAAYLVSNIAGASNEQASAIIQINKAVEQVSVVVQNNSATAEESAAASEELSSQAEVLKEMVGKFKLKQEAKGLLTGKTMLLTENHYLNKTQGEHPSESKIMLGCNITDKY